MGEQLVDLLLAFVGALVGEERLHFFGRRQRTDGVERHPAEEFAVAGQLRGHHVEAAEFSEHVTIDVVDFGHLGINQPRLRIDGNEDADGEDGPAIADDDGRVAGPSRLDDAEVGDFGDGVVIGAVVTQGGDVFAGVIVEGRLDLQPTDFAGLAEGVLGGGDPHGLHPPATGCPLGPLSDPGSEQLVLPGRLAEPRLSAVRRLPGRLEQEETLVGVAEVESPTVAIAVERVMILGGVVAEQRELEVALPLKRAVARPGRAAHSAEDAHDVPLEIHLFDRGAAGQRYPSVDGRCRQREQAKGNQRVPSGDAATHSAILRVNQSGRSSRREGLPASVKFGRERSSDAGGTGDND